MPQFDAVSGAGSAYGSTGAALAVVGRSGVVTRWTDAAEHLLGHRAEEILGRPAERLAASPGEAASWFGREWSGRTLLRRRDGRTMRVSLRVSALPGPDGTVDWLVSVLGAAESTPAVSVAENSPFPTAVWDSELRMVWLNAALARTYGPSWPRRLGLPLEESPLYADTDQVTALFRQVLETGVPVIDRELDQRDRRWRHTYALSVYPVENARDGEPGVCSTNVDVTTSRRARDRVTLLSRAGTHIGTTLDIMQTAQDLADVLVPAMADYVTVDLADAAEFGGEPLARLGTTGSGAVPAFHRAGMASIREGVPESLWARGDPVYVPPRSPFLEVLSTGRSYLEPFLDTSPGSWLDHDPGRLDKIISLGMHSLLVIPMHARGEILGVAVLVRTETLVPFDENDRMVAEEVVSRAALSLDNARRYTREHTAALALQRDLLPRNPNGGNALDVVWRYLPSDRRGGVGGDWFDVIELSGARIALVVGDVVGHGISAAAGMGRIRAAMLTLAALDLSPAEVLAHLDDLLARLAAEDFESKAMPTTISGATCLYIIYDPVTRRCCSARAGHPPPALVDPSGDVTLLDIPAGTPLGVGGQTYEDVTLELSEGSTLVLYTDGLVETRDRDIDFGLDRLRHALTQRPGAPLQDLRSAVVGTIPPGEQADDVVVLLARTRSLGPDQVVEWQLDADPSAVADVRATAVRALVEWGLERLVPVAEQIIGELLANAVLHAVGPLRLRLIRDQSLVCEVFDSSLNVVRTVSAGPDDEGGRGLAIIAALSSRHGSRGTPTGKCVWAELPLPPGTTSAGDGT
ncbi:SpoIIE family protein phosphatase [Streptomyces sp. NPDC059861]|uniref:SpoIIE family protein phosphatase n=1 Tax=Streptomyces sp. NPDC059861 TaxID=3346974 RepID=UPI003656BE19